jgi:hypothetical protein
MGQLAIMPPKAYRWVPEMNEVAKTMAASGITPKVFDGIADICDFVGHTALGGETPEQGREHARSGTDVVRLLAGDEGTSGKTQRRH